MNQQECQMLTRSLEITTTVGCSNMCTYCPQSVLKAAYERRAGARVLRLEAFEAYLRTVPQYVDLRFTGMSEPWLSPDCTKIVLHAHQKGHRIAVSSTLRGMRVSDVELLAQVPFRVFMVHLPSIEGYERIPTDKQYFNVLAKLLKSDINYGFHIHGSATMPRIREAIGEHVIQTAGTCDRSGHLALSWGTKRKHPRGSLRCIRLGQSVLMPNGDVAVCCMDYGLEHILGNLGDVSYHQLYEGAEFQRIVSALRTEEADTLCRRGCPHAVPTQRH